MKTKILLAAVAVAFSFAVTSCGNKKAADASAADACCAEQCDSTKACCKGGEGACQGECGKECDKKECDKAGCDEKACDKACDKQ